MTAPRPFDMSGFVIYTTATGGKYQAQRATRAEYDEAVRTGRLAVDGSVGVSPEIKMIGWLLCEEYHDFVLAETFVP